MRVKGENYQGTLQQGQKVYCGLSGGRCGHIVAVHGTPNPKSVGSFSVITYGGGADFDVIWDDGSKSNRVPECIIMGVQWDIFDEFIEADGILDLFALAEQYDADAKAEKERVAKARAESRIKHAENNPHLKPVEAGDYGGSKLAARNIRIELKNQFPGIKFSVTTDHDSVSVRWTDGPCVSLVEQFTKRHDSGTFDGMTDCQGWDDSNTFGQVFGECRYIWSSREFTGDKALHELVAKEFCRLQNEPEPSALESLCTLLDEQWWTVSRRILDQSIPAGHEVIGLEQVDGFSGRRDLNSAYKLVTQPKSADKVDAEVKAKKKYPIFTSKGYLATSPRYDWSRREFRKQATAEKEVAKLEKLGHRVEIVGGGRSNSRFIKLVDNAAEVAAEPVVDEPVAEAPVAEAPVAQPPAPEVAVPDYSDWL